MLTGRFVGFLTCGLLLILSSCSQPAAEPAGSELGGPPEVTTGEASGDSAAGPEQEEGTGESAGDATADADVAAAVERIAVGDKAPDFQLKDQNGATVALSDLLKEGKVAMVFYRSADW